MGFETEDVESTAPRRAASALPLPPLAGPRMPTTSIGDASPVLPLPGLMRENSAEHAAASGRGGQIGRYVVLKQIGSGGMGLVLAAYDPDLERKVALKILRDGLRDGSAGAVRMRREAQAMARLSHPNVAQVYEVAEAGGRLFLAMEFIEGATLREWLAAAPRPWQEVLAVYVEAGRGLAAAHAAGLMHRDFKPENAMQAADGRVRVLDFGLSRLYAASEEESAGGARGGALELQVTAVGSLLGTPAYMSPEQHERKEADARSDQFSFCVALWEALYGQRPFAGETMFELAKNVRRGVIVPPPAKTKVPAWVRRVLGRGLMSEPDQRWPTMEPLLAALTRAPQRARLLWSAAAALAFGAAAYAAAGWGAARAQVCSGAAEELIGVWDADARAAVERAVLATGVSYAERTATTVHERLDAYAARWVQIHGASCVAHQRGHVSPQLFDRRMACLRERRSELAATAAVLGQTSRESVAQASDAARGLPAISLCEDDARLLAAVAPPEDPQVAAAVEEARGRLALMHALERSGRYAEAHARMPAMVAEAEVLGFAPYTAEVVLLHGKLSVHVVDMRGRAQLERALWLAVAVQVDAVAAEAAVMWLHQVGSNEHRPLEAQLLVPLAQALVRRIGDPPGLVALLHNNTGTLLDELGDTAGAIAAYEQGLAQVVADAPDDSMRWALVNNLGLSLNKAGDFARVRTLIQTAMPGVEAAYDRCHMLAASMRGVLAASEAGLGEFAASAADYEVDVGCLASDYPRLAIWELAELTAVHLGRRDTAEVRRHLVRMEELARAAGPEERPYIIDLLRADAELQAGSTANAWAALAAVRAAGASDVQARVDTRLGLISHREHDDEAALALLLGAASAVDRRLGWPERGLHAFTLARVLRALGREPERAATLAAQALAAYEVAGAAYAADVAEIRGWQAADPKDR